MAKQDVEPDSTNKPDPEPPDDIRNTEWVIIRTLPARRPQSSCMSLEYPTKVSARERACTARQHVEPDSTNKPDPEPPDDINEQDSEMDSTDDPDPEPPDIHLTEMIHFSLQIQGNAVPHQENNHASEQEETMDRTNKPAPEPPDDISKQDSDMITTEDPDREPPDIDHTEMMPFPPQIQGNAVPHKAHNQASEQDVGMDSTNKPGPEPPDINQSQPTSSASRTETPQERFPCSPEDVNIVSRCQSNK